MRILESGLIKIKTQAVLVKEAAGLTAIHAVKIKKQVVKNVNLVEDKKARRESILHVVQRLQRVESVANGVKNQKPDLKRNLNGSPGGKMNNVFNMRRASQWKAKFFRGKT